MENERGQTPTFSKRLRAAGKLPKVALAACMRTLVLILNALVKTGRPWQPTLSQA